LSTPCIICGGQNEPFLTKHFHEFSLGDVAYVKCAGCGFVMSQSHYDMTDAAWERLNHDWVSQYQGTDHNPEDPRWLERCAAQSAVIADVASLGLLPAGRKLDYGAGDGKLSGMLLADHGLHFEKYEHTSNPAAGYLSAAQLKPGAFSVVLHTAVMEHLRTRAQIDALFALVADNGVMGIHTLVAEYVPQNADWFYLLSVHCSFFSNRSMQVLFDQHGYRCSIYNVASRLWFWFKQPAEEVAPIIAVANARAVDPMYQYIFADHFVDYWK